MPNNSDARRNKREKKKNRQGQTSPSPPQQVAEQSVESFLSRSASDSGFQGEDDEVTWESAAGEVALDNSLSSFRRETVKEAKKRARKEALVKELEDVSDIDLTDEESAKAKDPSPRKTSLSPTQFLQSRASTPLSSNTARKLVPKGNSLVVATPVQVLEVRRSGASLDVPNEEFASTDASGAISIQQDQQGSSSASFPSPSFNMPPTEHAQALQRNLAAELILAGTGTPPFISPARQFQEPGTAAPMIAYKADRRNNLNPSVQVPETEADRVESHDQQTTQPRVELARGQAATSFRTAFRQGEIEGQDRLNAHMLQILAEDRVRARSRREAETPPQTEPVGTANAARAASTASLTNPVASTPVMDMFFCIGNLVDIRAEAGDFTLKDFSDYYAPDNVKKAPNAPNTFEPTRLVRGNHPLWAPFYNPGRTRLGDDGSVESDPNHPPHFRVSRELMGRMLHTFKKKYVDEDEQRKTSNLLSEHIRRETDSLTTNISRAAEMLQRRKDELQRQHDEVMAATHQHVLEVSRTYREAIGRHAEALQLSVQGTHVLAQGLKDEARKLKDVIVSSDIVPSLRLNGEELGYIKQLKELHLNHRVLLEEHRQLQESREGVVKQLLTAREVNRETSQLIADLETKIKLLEHDKSGLEFKQVKLKSEMETLKRKRRSTPSPPPAKPATTSKLRILQRGEKESTAAMEFSLSFLSSPN
jgi:hypothetical protein